jgi:hypothetical protein
VFHLTRATKGVKVTPGEARDLRGLAAFDPGPRRKVRRLVVFLGARRQMLEGGIEAVPLEEFVEELPR